jgi:multidrug efflux pump subunit AcrB
MLRSHWKVPSSLCPTSKTYRSITSSGSCEISAFMSWDANVDLSQQRIESSIAQIRNTLPPDLQITVEKMNPSILPVIGYTLETTGSTQNPIDMKQLALYSIKPYLSQVDGVAEVRIIGGKQKEYWLTLDPQKMSTLGITPDQLSNALAQSEFYTVERVFIGLPASLSDRYRCHGDLAR